MVYKPGQSGNPAGKRKGAPDRRREKYDVAAKLAAAGCDPIQVLMELMRPDQEPMTRLHAARILINKVAPDLKAIEGDFFGDRKREIHIYELDAFKVKMQELIEHNKSDH
jgi:hypothetical protein